MLGLAPILISTIMPQETSDPPEPLLLTANHKYAKTGTQGHRGTLTLLLDTKFWEKPITFKTMKFVIDIHCAFAPVA